MLEYIFSIFLIMGFFLLSYVGIHMTFEKDLQKQIPLIWEEGGFLNNLFKKIK